MRYIICSNCVIHEILVDYINENGSPEECSICNEMHISVDFRTDNQISQIIKGLIRFYYDGVYYSRRYGIQSAEDLLLEAKNIITIPEKSRREYQDDRYSKFISLLNR